MIFKERVRGRFLKCVEFSPWLAGVLLALVFIGMTIVVVLIGEAVFPETDISTAYVFWLGYMAWVIFVILRDAKKSIREGALNKAQ